MLQKFVKELQDDMGRSTPFKEDPPGTYTITFSDGITIHAISLPPGFTLKSEIIQCPKENEELLYAHALRANLFGKGTAGCALGLNEEGNVLTLTKTIDYNIEYKEFKELIEDFWNMVDFWRDEVQNKKYLAKR